MLRRYWRLAVVVMSWVPIAIAKGQDSPELARALERADRFDAAIGPKPQPVAKWVGKDRLAYSATGKAPWTVLDPATARVLESDADDSAVGGPGPAMGLPLGLAYFGSARPGRAPWTARTENDELIVLDSAGAERMKLQGAEKYGWEIPPQAWSSDRRYFVAVRSDIRSVHSLPIVDYSSAIEKVTYALYPKTGTPLPVD